MNKENITPAVSSSYTVGAILVDHWGYGQTNVDFYCIVKMSGDWVTVLSMTKESGPMSDSMVRGNLPGEIDLSTTPIRKKLKSYQGEVSGFSFRSGIGGGWCRLWKGEKETSSHYA